MVKSETCFSSWETNYNRYSHKKNEWPRVFLVFFFLLLSTLSLLCPHRHSPTRNPHHTSHPHTSLIIHPLPRRQPPPPLSNSLFFAIDTFPNNTTNIVPKSIQVLFFFKIINKSVWKSIQVWFFFFQSHQHLILHQSPIIEINQQSSYDKANQDQNRGFWLRQKQCRREKHLWMREDQGFAMDARRLRLKRWLWWI